ncbi:GntR family transcriptional regulator [Neorhodopirellula lusitana]|nr:GntR family transcriptional regulator [Neorhodopirellula lusitana]
MADPRYRQIANELLSEIAGGMYQPTGKLPSETQLVKRFDVSRPTAARALRELQDQGLIERRAGSGTFVRHKPAQRSEDQQVIGMLVPELGATEILEVICGDLARLARLHDYAMLWGDPREAQDRDNAVLGAVSQISPAAEDPVEASRQLCEPFIHRDVHGVFFAPFEHHVNSHRLNLLITDRFRQAGIAVILLDRDVHPFLMRSEFDLVGIDNFAAGYMAASHLLKLNAMNLAFVTPPQFAPTVSRRIAGVREAVLGNSGIHGGLQVIHVDPGDTKEVAKLIAIFASQVKGSGSAKRRPVRSTAKDRKVANVDCIDAIICSNDQVAATLMQTLAAAGIEVPRDVRLVGFDDVKYARQLTVPLTTIRQPCRDIAAVAFRAMLDSIEKVAAPARQYSLPVQLIVRESCGAYL